MSDTPRTDSIPRNGAFYHYRVEDVLKLARELERELAVEKDALEQMTMAANQLHKELADMERQRNDAVALNVLYHKTRQDHRNFGKNAQEQRDEWHAEAVKLRHVLVIAEDALEKAETTRTSTEALAAITEALK